MKRFMILLSAAAFVVAFSSLVSFASETAKGEDVAVSGMFTCVSCSLMNPEEPCGKGCCEKCIKAGDPAMLTDSNGERYILLTGEHMSNMMTPERYAMLGGEVTVKGVLVRDKGLQAIYVDSIEKK